MDSAEQSRLSLIKRREDIARQAFIDAVCLVYDYRLYSGKWEANDILYVRQELVSYCLCAQDAYNEVKELAIAIGNAFKAGYTAFWLREIKRLQEDCESEWSGKTAEDRSSKATDAHDDLYGGVK